MNQEDQNNQKKTEPAFDERAIDEAEKAARSASAELHAAIREDENGDSGKPEKAGFLRAIRTYREDVESAIATKKSSLFSLAAAEEARRSTIAKPDDGPAPRKRSAVSIWIFVGILFFVLGISAIIAIPFLTTSDSVEPELTPGAPLIASDTTVVFDMTGRSRREILNGLAFERETADISLGEIEHIILAEDIPSGRTQVGTRAFLGMIEARIDDSFARSLGEEYMLGIHAFDGNQPFLILKPRLFRNAFAGMLAWESSLLFDLSPLFATRGTPENTLTFEDTVIRNIDVRAITKEGKYVLMYGFLDDSTLLITTNEHTFGEIVSRRSSIRVF